MTRSDPRRAFRQGVVVNILNPKTAPFFLAFMPQFLDPGRGPVFVQVLLLGLTFIVLGLVTDGAYAVTAATLAGWFRRRHRTARPGTARPASCSSAWGCSRR